MIFAYPNAMLPFLAAQLHAPWSTGLMFAAPSAGAFCVSATSGWMPRVRRHGLAIAFAAAGWGAAMALAGVAPDVYVALACLAVAGGADECSAVFRDTMWKQSIPTTCAAGWRGSSCFATRPGRPGQLRSGAVAAVTSVRFSLASAGSPASSRWPAWSRRCPPSGATPDRRATGPSRSRRWARRPLRLSEWAGRPGLGCGRRSRTA